jgi:hypothetical protein
VNIGLKRPGFGGLSLLKPISTPMSQFLDGTRTAQEGRHRSEQGQDWHGFGQRHGRVDHVDAQAGADQATHVEDATGPRSRARELRRLAQRAPQHRSLKVTRGGRIRRLTPLEMLDRYNQEVARETVASK